MTEARGTEDETEIDLETDATPLLAKQENGSASAQAHTNGNGHAAVSPSEPTDDENIDYTLSKQNRIDRAIRYGLYESNTSSPTIGSSILIFCSFIVAFIASVIVIEMIVLILIHTGLLHTPAADKSSISNTAPSSVQVKHCYAQCLGWATELQPTATDKKVESFISTVFAAVVSVYDYIKESSIELLPYIVARQSSSKSPIPATATALPICNCTSLTPNLVIDLFFGDYKLRFPGVLTHRPSFSCNRGNYFLVDWYYTDGIGNSLWAYTLALATAMALNATIIHSPFVATHVDDGLETHPQRDQHFRFPEWEVSRAEWDACPENSLVKINSYMIESLMEEWRIDTPDLLLARKYINTIQSTQAEKANTTYMQQSLTDIDPTPIYYLTTEGDTPIHWVSINHTGLPRVDHISPGLTMHLRDSGVKQYWRHPNGQWGIYPSALEVSKILEIRYIAQNDQWRKQVFPQDLQTIRQGKAMTKSTSTTSIHALTATARTTPVTSSMAPGAAESAVSWSTSDYYHVSVPIRRGDVTLNTVGKDVMIPVDLRHRVMTNEAIRQILTTSIMTIKNISLIDTNYTLSGQDIIDRMIFTIYSEGDPAGFHDIIQTLQVSGIPLSRIRLQLGGKASHIFSLLVESDLIYMAPSSYSYAAACYFNSESVKIGSGWTFVRFGGCRNFVYAQWIHYIPTTVNKDERAVKAEGLGQQQSWYIVDTIDFQERIIRMVQRKQQQRRTIYPLIKDNYGLDYPLDHIMATGREGWEIRVR